MKTVYLFGNGNSLFGKANKTANLCTTTINEWYQIFQIHLNSIILESEKTNFQTYSTEKPILENYCNYRFT